MSIGKQKLPKNEIVDSDNKISKLIINIGRSDKVNPETLIRLINKTTRSRDTRIGKIDIKKTHTTFEVDSEMKEMIISKMKHIRYNRKLILVSIYNPDLIDRSKNKKYKPKKKQRRKSKY